MFVILKGRAFQPRQTDAEHEFAVSADNAENTPPELLLL